MQFSNRSSPTDLKFSDYLTAGVLGLSTLVIRGCAERMDAPRPDEQPEAVHATEPKRESPQLLPGKKDKSVDRK